MSDAELDGLIGNDAAMAETFIDDKTVTATMDPLDEVAIYIKIIQSRTGKLLTRKEAAAALAAERQEAEYRAKIKDSKNIGSLTPNQQLREVTGIVYKEYQNRVRLHLGIFKDNESLRAGAIFVSKWVLNRRTIMMRPWLMLRGNVGTGKSTMSYAVAQACQQTEHRSCEFVDALTLTDLYLNDRKYYESYYTKPILVVDDLGAEPATVMSYGTPVKPVSTLLTMRYNNWLKFKLTTIITTNLSPEQIEKVYGVRLLDRLMELCEVVTFVGDSYRYNKKFYE